MSDVRRRHDLPLEKACMLLVPAQAHVPSLWPHVPCSHADPLSPDNDHSEQGELLFGGVPFRIKLWGGLEKGKMRGGGRDEPTEERAGESRGMHNDPLGRVC